MTFEQFAHIVRAASAITRRREITVFGSNAVLPWLVKEKGIQDTQVLYDDASEVSRKLDLTVGDEELDTTVDAAIGELSMFDRSFKYHAHGVGIEGFKAPRDWQSRAMQIRIENCIVTVPHPADIVVSKLAAGRQKDLKFARRVVEVFGIDTKELSVLVQKAARDHPEYAETLQKSFSILKARVSVSDKDDFLSLSP